MLLCGYSTSPAARRTHSFVQAFLDCAKYAWHLQFVHEKLAGCPTPPASWELPRTGLGETGFALEHPMCVHWDAKLILAAEGHSNAKRKSSTCFQALACVQYKYLLKCFAELVNLTFANSNHLSWCTVHKKKDRPKPHSSRRPRGTCYKTPSCLRTCSPHRAF